jgi:hypothetical protein
MTSSLKPSTLLIELIIYSLFDYVNFQYILNFNLVQRKIAYNLSLFLNIHTFFISFAIFDGIKKTTNKVIIITIIIVRLFCFEKSMFSTF